MTPLQNAARMAAEEISTALEVSASICGLEAKAETRAKATKAIEQLILRHLAPIEAELNELQQIRDAIKSPAAVWANMLKGTIARPQALDHYEECKQRVEQLEAELTRWEPIENAPKGNNEIFVAKAFNVKRGSQLYTSDPWCCWYDDDLELCRWPHPFPPTHFMPIPKGPEQV